MHGPTQDFWQQRFASGSTPWNRGDVSPQLQPWLDEACLRGRVVVPGCGHGHELRVLAAAGLDVTALDYAPAACELARLGLKAAGLAATVVQADVLSWHPDAPVDAVFEQTCLCALHPDHWVAYAEQLHGWLKPGGCLCALFMQCRRDGAAEGRIEGPPYHLDMNAMRALFPVSRWDWPKPPFARVKHPAITGEELAVVLVRR